jgi:hypothetical protein
LNTNKKSKAAFTHGLSTIDCIDKNAAEELDIINRSSASAKKTKMPLLNFII